MKRLRLIAVALVVLAPACADDLRFREDKRLRFIAPAERAVVRTPLLVDWDMARAGDIVFGVFVDETPMRPGRDLASLAEDDPSCSHVRGCPDRDWLERHGIFVTNRTRVAVPLLSDDRGRPGRDGRRHDITIVLLDRRGVRIGESAWTRTVFAEEQER